MKFAVSSYAGRLLKATGCVAIMAFATSCRQPERPAWSHFSEVSSHGWDPRDVMIFEPLPPDSTVTFDGTYDFDVILRSTTRRDIWPLPVAVSIEDATGVIRADTLVLGSDRGPRLTKKRAYGVEQATFRLLENTPLPEGFSISLNPLLEASESKGLLNIGIEMREHARLRDASDKTKSSKPKNTDNNAVPVTDTGDASGI